MKKQLKNYIMIVCFLLFIFGFAVASFISEDREFSENENRYLQQAPEFSWKKLEKGEFTSDIESYMSDQIFMKDQLVSLKTVTDRTLLKNYQNGVYFGKDGYYLQDYQENRPLIEKNISCLNDFADSLDKSVDVSFLLVPNAVSVMSDKLPAVTQTDDQLESEKYISSILSDRINLCFPYDQLKDAAKSTQVFYKTDHHWTAEGAKVGFDALMTAMNEDIPQVSYNIETVKDFHGTLYSKAPTDFSAADEMHFYTNPDNSVKVNYVEENKQTDTLFDDSFKTKKDKYSTFMGGNFALTEIETNGESDEHVLIIKDSYANTVMPYFADKYKHITMIDMRYYHIMDKTVSEYVKDNGITKVIFLYIMDFVNTDNNFIWLE